MEVFRRCKECGLLKDPEQGRLIIIKDHITTICDGRVSDLIERGIEIIWVCTKCLGPSSSEVDIPLPKEEA